MDININKINSEGMNRLRIILEKTFWTDFSNSNMMFIAEMQSYKQ